MRLRADQKLFLSYLALIAAVVAALTFSVGRGVRQHLMTRQAEDLRRELNLARELHAARSGVAPDALADRIGELLGRRITLVAADGRVLGDSERDGAQLADMENHGNRPEVLSARERGYGQSIRRSASLGVDLMYAALPAQDDVVIRAAAPMRQIDAAVSRVQRGIYGAGLLALALTALLSLGFSRAITRPLRQILSAARDLAAGDLGRRARLRRRDELGELADVMNSLAEELQRRLGQLEGERAEMQALIDAMAEGVIAWTAQGRVQRANPAALRLFGLGPEARGAPAEAVSRRPAFLDLVRRAVAGERLPPVELALEGQQLLITAQPLPRGGAVMVMLDVSELRRLEDVRRDFVANASHELKTPLTVIRGYSETLLDEDLPAELRRQFAGAVKANAERLQRIVDDLLDLSRFESRGFRIDPEIVSVRDLAQDALEPCRSVLDARGITMDLATPPDAEYVHADPGAVRQALANLISNAIRYVPVPGGRITIASRRLPAGDPKHPGGDGDWLEVVVRDNGSGIPAAHLPRIFERFYRVDAARSREEGGTGLGLAIVRHLVEAHGGRVEAESRVGQGTTIRLVLPAAREEPPE